MAAKKRSRAKTRSNKAEPKNRTWSGKLGHELHAAALAERERLGITTSDLVRHAIAQFVGVDESLAAPPPMGRPRKEPEPDPIIREPARPKVSTLSWPPVAAGIAA